MKTKELTDLLNKRLGSLELRIKARPQGGDFNSLRRFLNEVIKDCRDFQSLLDRLDDPVGINETILYQS